jgi:hypothetical protein
MRTREHEGRALRTKSSWDLLGRKIAIAEKKLANVGE